MQVRLFIILSITFMLTACEPIVHNRGHVADDKIIDFVRVGETTQSAIRDRFGSPSSRSNFGDETWYYIQMRKEAKAFLAPEITKQDVVQITFYPDQTVKSIDQYGKGDARKVAIVDDETPTEGHSLGFFEQVFGNIGRFNKDRTVDANRPRR